MNANCKIYISRRGRKFQEDCKRMHLISCMISDSYKSGNVDDRRCNNCYLLQFLSSVRALVEKWGIKMASGDICVVTVDVKT